jgi:magnesium-transporting ATPase (P-type)
MHKFEICCPMLQPNQIVDHKPLQPFHNIVSTSSMNKTVNIVFIMRDGHFVLTFELMYYCVYSFTDGVGIHYVNNMLILLIMLIRMFILCILRSRFQNYHPRIFKISS